MQDYKTNGCLPSFNPAVVLVSPSWHDLKNGDNEPDIESNQVASAVEDIAKEFKPPFLVYAFVSNKFSNLLRDTISVCVPFIRRDRGKIPYSTDYGGCSLHEIESSKKRSTLISTGLCFSCFSKAIPSRINMWSADNTVRPTTASNSSYWQLGVITSSLNGRSRRSSGTTITQPCGR